MVMTAQELQTKVEDALQEIRPFLQSDGGDISLVSIEDGKTVRVRKKFHAHDERNDAHLGDTVRIVETRPLSKTKRWRVSEVVERAR